MKRRSIIAVLMTAILGFGYQEIWAKENQLSGRPLGSILFQIGQEDGAEFEFNSSNLKNVHEFTCSAPLGCKAEVFPRRLYIHPRKTIREVWTGGGVAKVSINFTLDIDQEEVVLRLARAGDETTLVTLNGEQEFLITSEILGSREGGLFSAYNLSLGSINKGMHTIQFTVVDDGKGNGRYAWDSISLYVN